MKRFIIAAVFFIFFIQNSFGQGSVTLTPYPGNPTGGCNYTVTMNYKIEFSGTNVPSNMWTLQGVVRCNESTFFNLPNQGGVGTVTSANASYNGNPGC